ncbi:hypothetical protein B484DRAFT_329017, partial [Ochromonadaceae sp. CCMP2298]
PHTTIQLLTLMFCQFFLSRETRKLTDSCRLREMSPGVMSTLATARDMHTTFFIWNLILSFSSSTVGNLPALVRPGPRMRGICLISVAEARKLLYFLENFFISFLFLLNFFRSSTVILSIPSWSAFSQCFWLPSTHTELLGLGTIGRRKVPEKRLSREGS